MYQKVASFSFLDTPPKTDTNNFQPTGILYEISTNSFSWGGSKKIFLYPPKIVSVCFGGGLKN